MLELTYNVANKTLTLTLHEGHIYNLGGISISEGMWAYLLLPHMTTQPCHRHGRTHTDFLAIFSLHSCHPTLVYDPYLQFTPAAKCT